MKHVIAAILSTMLASAGLANAAFADSWGEFMDCRVVDPTGKYYVVLTKADGWQDDPGRGGPVDYVIAQRRGDDPVASASDSYDLDRSKFNKDPHVRVRKGDYVTGKGRLERAPLYVQVSSKGFGFVTADVHGYNYGDATSKTALVHVAADGKIQTQKSWNEIFAEQEIPLFTTTAGGTMWLQGIWIDEDRQEFVVVGRAHKTPDEAVVVNGEMQYLFRGISLRTGAVKNRTSAVALVALQRRNLGALTIAIPLSLELGLPNAERLVEEIATDNSVPDGIRKGAQRTLEARSSRRNR